METPSVFPNRRLLALVALLPAFFLRPLSLAAETAAAPPGPPSAQAEPAAAPALAAPGAFGLSAFVDPLLPPSASLRAHWAEFDRIYLLRYRLSAEPATPTASLRLLRAPERLDPAWASLLRQPGPQVLAVLSNRASAAWDDRDANAALLLLGDPGQGSRAGTDLLAMARADGFTGVAVDLASAHTELAQGYAAWLSALRRQGEAQGVLVSPALYPRCVGCPLDPANSGMQDAPALAAAGGPLLVFMMPPNPLGALKPRPAGKQDLFSGTVAYWRQCGLLGRSHCALILGGETWTLGGPYGRLDWDAWQRLQAETETSRTILQADGRMICSLRHGGAVFYGAEANLHTLTKIKDAGFAGACLVGVGNEDPGFWERLADFEAGRQN